MFAEAGLLFADREPGLLAILASSVSGLPVVLDGSGNSLIASAFFCGQPLTADGRIPWAPATPARAPARGVGGRRAERRARRRSHSRSSAPITRRSSPPSSTGSSALMRVAAGALQLHETTVHPEPRPDAAGDVGLTATEAPRRVLIAEDETIIRLDLRGLLEKSGFDVCGEARDGVEAVELAASLEPDVIVMDVKMPRLDGIEAAKRILEKRPVPIVMLTAFGQEELVARAVDVGVFGYLAKPFREQDVIPALIAAQARHAEFAEVKLHASSLLEALEARKSIERAKGILMAKEGLSEEEAFARLRRASQRSGRPMKVIADAVAATLG